MQSLSNPKDDYLRAAGMIMGAVAVNGLWAAVVMLFLSGPLLAFDAHMVSWIMGVPASGNILILNDDGSGLTVGI